MNTGPRLGCARPFFKPPDVWRNGEPEGVRRRAARKLILTARAARAFFNLRPGRPGGNNLPAVVNGFTGSSIWHSIYPFPPTSQDYWEKGFQDFARRFGPILDAFDRLDVNFGLEVHPTEIAFDTASAQRAVAAVRGTGALDSISILRILPTKEPIM
jgi:hypothetical protein